MCDVTRTGSVAVAAVARTLSGRRRNETAHKFCSRSKTPGPMDPPSYPLYNDHAKKLINDHAKKRPPKKRPRGLAPKSACGRGKLGVPRGSPGGGPDSRPSCVVPTLKVMLPCLGRRPVSSNIKSRVGTTHRPSLLRSSPLHALRGHTIGRRYAADIHMR